MFNHYTRLKDPTLNMCVQLIFLIQYALSDQGHNIQSYPICTTKSSPSLLLISNVISKPILNTH